MQAVAVPQNEIGRLGSLRDYGILDTPPDPRFDVITRITRRVLKVSTAVISFVDEDRQWMKSALGMFGPGEVTARDIAFCSTAILTPTQPLVIEDAAADPRFSQNPLVLRPGGIRFYAGVPLLDDDGQALGTLCIIDTVPRRLLPDELDLLCDLAATASVALSLHRGLAAWQASEQHRQDAVEQNPQIPWTATPEGHLLEVSPSLIVTLAALSEDNLHRSDWTRLVHPDDLPEATKRRERAVRAGEPYDIEHRMRTSDGSWRWFRSYAAPRRDASGNIALWYGSSEDITDRKLSEAQVMRLAYHDTLTGLPNRASFGALLESEILRARGEKASFAMHCLDLDHFKGVNDRLGHPAGDALLKQIAERLKSCLAPADFLARFGSDEFFIIQVDPDQPDGAARLAERIAASLAEPLVFAGHVFSISSSIGVACYPQHGTDSDELFRNADLALHRAKTQGRAHCCLFEADIDEKNRLRLALKLDLQDAINRDEFELAYQPLFNLRTGRIDGFEALLRWRHPTRGWVSPAEFIPCAEECGLIIPIGEWVLDRACRAAAAWAEDLHLAVNLSPVQFRDRGLLGTIVGTIEASGLAPTRLELEITESVLLLDDEDNIALLRNLRERGIRIALDDFGTGYSSLSTLQRFTFDKLKIDRSLVSRITEGEPGRAVVRAVIAMSRAMGISVTAEGVETQEQFDQLRAENCDQIQGYLISRPVPPSEIQPLVQKLNGGC